MSVADSLLRHIAPRVADLHPEVRRAWDLNGGVVLSFTRFIPDSELPREPETEPPRIAIVAKDRLQVALDRAHKEFGDGKTVLQFPRRLGAA